MNMTKLDNIKQQLIKYRDYDFNDSVEERLENTLTRYLEELEKAFIRLGYLTPVNAIKELSK